MCVNENVLHFGHVHMPIGGVGASGIGKYQGKNSFHEFSHKKSVMQKKFFPDFTFRYPPYDSKKLNQLKFFFRNFWG
jgi:aldehyde dehydrogenase (NAD+)